MWSDMVIFLKVNFLFFIHTLKHTQQEAQVVIVFAWLFISILFCFFVKCNKLSCLFFPLPPSLSTSLVVKKYAYVRKKNDDDNTEYKKAYLTTSPIPFYIFSFFVLGMVKAIVKKCVVQVVVFWWLDGVCFLVNLIVVPFASIFTIIIILKLNMQ